MVKISSIKYQPAVSLPKLGEGLRVGLILLNLRQPPSVSLTILGEKSKNHFDFHHRLQGTQADGIPFTALFFFIHLPGAGGFVDDADGLFRVFIQQHHPDGFGVLHHLLLEFHRKGQHVG